MTFLFKVSALAVSLGLLLASSHLAAVERTAELKTLLLHSIENAAPNVSYTDIEWDQPTDLAIAQCNPISAVGKIRASNLRRASFELRCLDASSYRFSALLSGTAEVLIASELIQRKEGLGSHNVAMQTLPLHEIRGETIGQPIRDGHYMASRNYAVGQAINPRYIDVAPVIKKGMNVKSVARIGPLEVQVEVKALEDGGVGELIKVQNTASKTSFYAKVVSHSVVVKE